MRGWTGTFPQLVQTLRTSELYPENTLNPIKTAPYRLVRAFERFLELTGRVQGASLKAVRGTVRNI